jgi:hypothetical protein
MDQTLVRSGFDAEILLGERYLQYLLLLAVDVGIIPSELTFEEPGHPERGLFHGRLIVPNDLDRTYEPDAAAVLPEASTLPVTHASFVVEVLFGHPLAADLKIQVFARIIRAEDGLDLPVSFAFYVRLGISKVTASDGALDSASVSIELVQVDSPLPSLDLLPRFKPIIDRALDLGGLGSGGRFQDIALRKFPADGETPAALGVYLNLRLRSGPESDRFLTARGDTALGQNFLPADADLIFATRPDLYGALSRDTKFRRAVASGNNFSYPIRVAGRDGTLDDVTVEAVRQMSTTNPPPPPVFTNQLRVRAVAEIEVDHWPDPEITLTIDIFSDTDSEGVMTWNSSSDGHASGFFAHLLLAGAAAVFIFFLGPVAAVGIFVGLEILKSVAESLTFNYFTKGSDRVEERLDATLLDIAPNRLTVVRRHWDPLYETQHQIGLRPGGTLITDKGIALWGRAVLTRATQPIRDAVIRDTERDAADAPTALRYRSPDIETMRAQLTQMVPAVDRRTWMQPDPIADPLLVQVTVADALSRISENRLIGAHPYLVKGIEMIDGDIGRLLVISKRESNEQSDRLLDEKTVEVTASITAAQEPTVRAKVIADFAAAGIIPTQQDIDNAVAAALQALINEAVSAYADSTLATDLEAALQPLLRFQLSPTQFGELQTKGVLTIEGFDLIHVHATHRFYYRDHYQSKIETTAALRKADNLINRPRYRTTPTGPEFL